MNYITTVFTYHSGLHAVYSYLSQLKVNSPNLRLLFFRLYFITTVINKTIISDSITKAPLDTHTDMTSSGDIHVPSAFPAPVTLSTGDSLGSIATRD